MSYLIICIVSKMYFLTVAHHDQKHRYQLGTYSACHSWDYNDVQSSLDYNSKTHHVLLGNNSISLLCLYKDIRLAILVNADMTVDDILLGSFPWWLCSFILPWEYVLLDSQNKNEFHSWLWLESWPLKIIVAVYFLN